MKIKKRIKNLICLNNHCLRRKLLKSLWCAADLLHLLTFFNQFMNTILYNNSKLSCHIINLNLCLERFLTIRITPSI